MQVSDLLGQYGNNIASGSQVTTKVKGVEQLVDTTKQLKAGNVFEGTVNFVKGNQVVLGLSSGQNITAHLDKGITLEKGQSVFFQVKSNDGQTIQIKPMSQNGTFMNLTLTSALDAANLPVNERNINMVNAMMKQQMPIDAKSLQDMSRMIASNKSADPAAVVEMTKLNIPLTSSNVSMYENYKMDQGAVVKQMSELFDSITEMISDDSMSVKDAAGLQSKLVDFFTSANSVGGTTTATNNVATLQQNVLADGAATQQGNTTEGQVIGQAVTADGQVIGQAVTADGQVIGQEVAADGQIIGQAVTTDGQVIGQAVTADGQVIGQAVTIDGEVLQQHVAVENTVDGQGATKQVVEYPEGSLGNLLSGKDISQLSTKLSSVPEFAIRNQEFFDYNGQLKPGVNSADILKSITSFLNSNSSSISKEIFSNIVGDKAFRNILEDVATEKMTLRPEDLTGNNAVKDLYQKLNQQMSQLKDIVSNFPKVSETVNQAANNISSNIDFMNALNQMYAYVQIPLKMSGQNVNGELYVYRNKNVEKDDDQEMSAFLHFEMDNLGPVDISVKLKDKNVTTNWYLEDVSSLELIANNIDLLTKRLQAKGYNCEFSFDDSAKETNFVEDILQVEAKNQGHVQRYSFDVRA